MSQENATHNMNFNGVGARAAFDSLTMQKSAGIIGKCNRIWAETMSCGECGQSNIAELDHLHQQHHQQLKEQQQNEQQLDEEVEKYSDCEGEEQLRSGCMHSADLLGRGGGGRGLELDAKCQTPSKR
ncbi:unnamed protein product [Nippostrongylus brasiliensis]|uniref:C2H2-type domain-containing protein n=1 Tax=Nippostrongylus brasiliensis TaxID=27835 RepID=A0A0N4YL73_NIPBR|nr:unnamed protein product [Nippostrongylus brasiliensis]